MSQCEISTYMCGCHRLCVSNSMFNFVSLSLFLSLFFVSLQRAGTLLYQSVLLLVAMIVVLFGLCFERFVLHLISVTWSF